MNLLKDVVDKPTVYSAEGTLAHEVLDALLSDGHFDDYPVGMVRDIDGFDISVTQEMHDCAIAARNYILMYITTLRLNEARVNIDLSIRNGDGELVLLQQTSGTTDVNGVPDDPEDLTLHVFDYKYGQGRPVYAKRNTQLALYGLGVLDTFGFFWERPFKQVALHIIQPRHAIASKQEPWVLTIDELEEMRRHFSVRAHESQVDPQFRPGLKTCEWCALKATCEALAAHNAELLDNDFEDLEATNDSFTAEHLARIKAQAPLIREWLNAVDEEVLRRLEHGGLVPGFKLVEGRRGNRTWSDADEVQAILTAARAGDSMWEHKLVTPTQAEKRLSKGRWAKVKEYITRAPGKPAVVPEDDPRPALGSNDYEDLDESALLS